MPKFWSGASSPLKRKPLTRWPSAPLPLLPRSAQATRWGIYRGGCVHQRMPEVRYDDGTSFDAPGAVKLGPKCSADGPPSIVLHPFWFKREAKRVARPPSEVQPMLFGWVLDPFASIAKLFASPRHPRSFVWCLLLRPRSSAGEASPFSERRSAAEPRFRCYLLR